MYGEHKNTLYRMIFGRFLGSYMQYYWLSTYRWLGWLFLISFLLTLKRLFPARFSFSSFKVNINIISINKEKCRFFCYWKFYLCKRYYNLTDPFLKKNQNVSILPNIRGILKNLCKVHRLEGRSVWVDNRKNSVNWYKITYFQRFWFPF